MGLAGDTSSGSHLLTVKTREVNDGAMITIDAQSLQQLSREESLIIVMENIGKFGSFVSFFHYFNTKGQQELCLNSSKPPCEPAIAIRLDSVSVFFSLYLFSLVISVFLPSHLLNLTLSHSLYS